MQDLEGERSLAALLGVLGGTLSSIISNRKKAGPRQLEGGASNMCRFLMGMGT